MSNLIFAGNNLHKKTQVKLHLQKKNGVYIQKNDKYVQATCIQHAYPGEYEIAPRTRHISASKNYDKKFENKVVNMSGVNVEVQTDDINVVGVNRLVQCDFKDFLININDITRNHYL